MEPEFTEIDYPGAYTTQVKGINSQGEVVGISFTHLSPTADIQEVDGFIYNDGYFTKLTVTGALFTHANAISDNGYIAGEYYPGGPGDHAFIYKNGNYVDITYPGARDTFAYGVNNQGDVVGRAVSNTFFVGYAYVDGRFTQIPGTPFDINNKDQIVGAYGTSGFLYDHGKTTMINVPGAIVTVARGINSSGEIAGYYLDTNLKTHGFLYDNGDFTTIDDPNSNGYYTQIYGINNSGEIVGVYRTPGTGDDHGFLFG